MENSDELRKRLKNERQSINESINDGSTDKSSTNTELNSTNKSNEIRYSIQSIPGQSGRTTGFSGSVDEPKGKSSDIFGSTTQIDTGKRSGARRFGSNNKSSWSNGTNLPASPNERSFSVRRVGNLEAAEDIPYRDFSTDDEIEETVRNEPKKRGRPKKPDVPVIRTPEIQDYPKPDKKEKPIRKIGGSTLTQEEANNLKEPLKSALKDQFSLIDKGIWSVNGDPLEQPIWGDMTEEELNAIVNSVLRLGQKSPIIATGARVTVDAADYITAGIVLGPRIKTTVDTIRKFKTNDNKNKRR